MKKHTIAIIEDEIELLNMLGLMCRDLKHSSFEFRTFEDFIFKFPTINPDLIITDRNLPGSNGNVLIESIRKLDTKIPILMISGSNAQENIIEALRLGADDFISKPFHPEVLALKIAKLFNKPNDDLYLDPSQRLVRSNELSVYLTVIEFKIFEKLYHNFESFVARDTLLQSENSRSLDVHINKLRKKLKSFNLSLETIRGTGYCLKKSEVLKQVS